MQQSYLQEEDKLEDVCRGGEEVGLLVVLDKPEQVGSQQFFHKLSESDKYRRILIQVNNGTELLFAFQSTPGCRQRLSSILSYGRLFKYRVTHLVNENLPLTWILNVSSTCLGSR